MPKKRLAGAWPLAALGLIVLAVFWPSLAPYPVFGHSAGPDAVRLFEMDRGVRGGSIYPRWSPDLYFGYGSPLLNFYAPLPYFVAEGFHLLGASQMWAMKLSYLTAVLLSTLGIYALSRRELMRLAPDIPTEHANATGVIAALVYVFAPYFLVDLYVRSSVSELYGFGLVPWVFFFLGRLRDEGDRKFIGAAAVAYGLLCLCHNISALIYSPLILLYIIWTFPSGERRRGIAACVVGLAAGAFFWLPALALKGAVQSERHLTTGYFSFQRHFLELAELFVPRWGFQAPGAGDGGMSTQLGLVHWFLLLTGVAALALPALSRRFSSRPFWTGNASGDGKSAAGVLGPYLLIAVVGLFFTHSSSSALWSHLPLLKFVQFPWRFLMVLTFSSTLCVVGVMDLARRFRPGWGVPGMCVLLGLAVIPAYAPYAKAHYVFLTRGDISYREVRPEDIPTALEDPNLVSFEEFFRVPALRMAGITGTASDDFLPVGVEVKPGRPAKALFHIASGQGRVEGEEVGFNAYLARIDAQTRVVLQLSVFFFPGWTARLDGVIHPLKAGAKTGLIELSIPPGRHLLKIHYGKAPIHRAADFISFVACLVMIAALWPSRRGQGDRSFPFV